jgi:hypothetical protein
MVLFGYTVIFLLVAILVELFSLRSDLRKAQGRNFPEIYEIKNKVSSSEFYLERINEHLIK